HYDVPTDVPGAAEHRLGATGRHAVRVEPGTRLAALARSGELHVSSRHHQAVSDPGPELRVSARAAGGVGEAIAAESGPFRLGVQWHPESQDDAESEALFRAFVAAAEPGQKRKSTRAARSRAKRAV